MTSPGGSWAAQAVKRVLLGPPGRGSAAILPDPAPSLAFSTGGMYHGDLTEKLKVLYKLHLPPGESLLPTPQPGSPTCPEVQPQRTGLCETVGPRGGTAASQAGGSHWRRGSGSLSTSQRSESRALAWEGTWRRIPWVTGHCWVQNSHRGGSWTQNPLGGP